MKVVTDHVKVFFKVQAVLLVNFDAQIDGLDESTLKTIPLRSQTETVHLGTNLKETAQKLISTFISRVEDIVGKIL